MNRKGRRAARAGGQSTAPAAPPLFNALRQMGDQELQAGRLAEAEDLYRRALALNPDDPASLHGLGNVLIRQGRAEPAVSSYRHALALSPGNVSVLINLGQALYASGQPEAAIAAWRDARAAEPRHPLPAMNLGIALIQRGRYDEAIVEFRQACEFAPESPEALTNLARAYVAGGDIPAALQAIWRALALRETQDAKAVFAECLRRFRFTEDMPELRGTVARAITEAWARPDDISGAAIDLVKQSTPLAAATARLAAAWPERLAFDALWPAGQRTAVWNDPLLRALMQSAPLRDFDLERFLINIRSKLLVLASDGATVEPELLQFHCALARQCFINEYVYAVDEDEMAAARRLWQPAEAGAEISASALAAVASYLPLHTLAGADAVAARSWPDAVKELIVQQIAEPREEARLRADIPVLTAIDDAISVAVREQYEQNPYPRWTKTPRGIVPQTVAQTFRTMFPHMAARFADRGGGCDVLIAGCGTGQQPIEAAQRYRGARVLAVDLSLTSLSYAQRKTRELGVTSIDYALADILKLGAIGRGFDVIESGGVLHHLNDPFAGWRVLISLLRPGGFMYLGLYSAIGRSRIVAARAMIAQRGYRSTAHDIRRFRQALAAEAGESDLKRLLRSPDFYSLSGCRDLCFHVNEHHLTLPQIKAFLAENDLEFLGFVLEADTIARFQKKFPGADGDLDRWHAFETENPNLFSNLYNFWVRKPG